MRLTLSEKQLILELLVLMEAQPIDDDGNGEGDYQAYGPAEFKRCANIIKKLEGRQQ